MIDKIQYLKRIPFDKQDIIIIGSAVLIAHGIDIVNNDLDVAVRRDILDVFLSRRGIICEKTYMVGNHIELSYGSIMTDKSFNDLNKNADIIEHYSFMSLPDLKGMYLAMGREKDKEKLVIVDKLIKDY